MLKSSLFIAGLFASTSALAQQAPAPDAAATEAKDGAAAVVVTATRIPLPADRVTASVTVLDKDAIDRSQDLGVTELLLRTPGVSIARNGGYGTATSLRIRGAESEQTVVVLDGVKLNDPSAIGGGYNFANLLTGDAARIEVLRGPQSILWGSQAIGGVVNIVTPLGERPLEGSFDVEAGSRDTVSARAALGGRNGPLAWRIAGQAFTTDGISAIASGTEPDGYRNRSVAGRALLDVTSGVSVEVRGLYSNARADLDGFGVDSPEYTLNREFVGYAGLNVALFGGRFRNRFGYGYTSVDRSNYNPTPPAARTFDGLGRNERLEYQGSVAIADGWDVTFGVEDERARFRTNDPFSGTVRARAGITSVYGQVNATPIAGLTLSGGVRHDDHDRFGSKTQASAGAVYVTPWGTVARASYGEGFKAPSLYQLFSEYGNTTLRPEDAHGWEAGLEQRFVDGAVTAGATYFERQTRDQIGFFSCSFTNPQPLCITPTGTRFGYYANIARAAARGIEASASVRPVKPLLIAGNYSWVAAEDRTPGASFGKSLARRPRHTANASIDYAFDAGGSIGAALRWSGESFENAANTVRLAPYTLVDLRGDVPISANVRLFARVENLFDESYQTARGYGTLGRSIYAGLRGRF
ncbi:TonB-dependent receptor plug domain-containing protein [Sphingomonas sp.]|uniref:TonB-dependent receptor plug domain-containing protein n=1 Tax=Sphingomonas sp. TaxID=28214 RepID=UPI002DD6B41B|nr:TonB-dependent receptor [Sphingomonas sp.]